MAQWLEHGVVLLLVAGCVAVIARGILRWAAGRQRGGCGGCAKCEPSPADKPAAKSAPKSTGRIVFLPAGQLGRKR